MGSKKRKCKNTSNIYIYILQIWKEKNLIYKTHKKIRKYI